MLVKCIIRGKCVQERNPFLTRTSVCERVSYESLLLFYEVIKSYFDYCKIRRTMEVKAHV